MANQKTILITGATSGIGESLLQRYLANGYQVIACGRNEEKLKQLSDQNSDVIPLAFDITNIEQICNAANKLTEIKPIDILMLNAGDCRYIDNAKSFDGALFASVIATNLQFLGYMLENFLPKVAVGGQVVFVSSSATILPFPRAGFIKTPLTDKNDFPMPFLLTSEQAANRIYQGVNARKAYLQFPKRLTFIMRLFALLPDFIWQSIALKNENNKRNDK